MREREGRTAQRGSYEVADAVEEEEFRDDKGLDKHYGAGGDDGGEPDDVHDAEDVEDYIAWTGQGAFEERHGREK